MPESRITVLLLNHRRPENIPIILDSIGQQTCKADIFLWDNSNSDWEDSRVTWRIRSSKNGYCWPRWFMASQAETPYFVTLDDDICFSQSGVLSTIVDLLDNAKHKDQLIGPEGVRLSNGCPYFPLYVGRVRRQVPPNDVSSSVHFHNVDIDQPVDIIKGRSLAGRTDVIRQLPLWHADGLLCDDIVLSGLVSRGRPCHHLVPSDLANCFVDLPGVNGPMALSQMPEWGVTREDATRRAFASHDHAVTVIDKACKCED